MGTGTDVAMERAQITLVQGDLLYPPIGVLMWPMPAAAAMSLSSVSVIANALRLRRVNLDV